MKQLDKELEKEMDQCGLSWKEGAASQKKGLARNSR